MRSAICRAQGHRARKSAGPTVSLPGTANPAICPIMTHAELLTFAWVQMSRGSGDTIQLRVGVDPNMPPLWSATNPLSFHAAGGISLRGVRSAKKIRLRNRSRESGLYLLHRRQMFPPMLFEQAAIIRSMLEKVPPPARAGVIPQRSAARPAAAIATPSASCMI